MLKPVRKVPDANHRTLPGVTYVTNNPPCAKSEHNLVAGTTWLFASPEMRGAPVDVLIVDEAGQLALADALAASTSAKNLVLLGDPLQLPQVAQAVHPGGGGLSVLQHVLGHDVTMPPDRGVFLTETRRMHPNVCRFISEEIYEGRLQSHPSCAQQDTAFGTGLRWLQADHEGCSTESLEEAQLVVGEIDRLLGTPWVNHHGVTNPLTVQDFMVVAPYNDQVALLRETLDADPRTRGVPVGTVDKFQGREAAVVFFTMTTSSSGFMPRSAEFLFSRNRLNVAISRARCLAYLVCTEDLLNSRARTIEEMRLVSTLCSFVEYCEG
jgi:superfamily I DNA and/or RNA helicase